MSCQGFSLNQIIIWNNEGERQNIIHGHTSRVLYCALSPKGHYVATGAGDRSLKFWKMFPRKEVTGRLEVNELR